MKPREVSVVRRRRHLATGRLLLLAALALPGCAGDNAPGTSEATIRTIVAGRRPFGNAIDADGNIWVANKGNGNPGTDAGCSNRQVFVGAASGPQYVPQPGPFPASRHGRQAKVLDTVKTRDRAP